MESKRMFLVVCVIVCAVSFIEAESNISPATTLTSKITHNECGKTKLCLDNPKGCDPSGSSQCFFTSVILTTSNITVELSGNSPGYIALAAGLTSNISQDRHVIFVCGNITEGVVFQTTTLNNNTLGVTNMPYVNNFESSIQSSLIQCVFSIPIDGNVISFLSSINGTHINISDIANSQILIYLDILKGSNNGTVLGAPTSVLESSVLVNLLNVNSTNVVSTTAVTTANITAGITAGTAGTTADTTTYTTAGTTTYTTAGTTTYTTAGTTARTTADTTARTTAGNTARTTANTTAGTTANSTAGTTANTTAGTTANTTAGTTAGTTARTTAKSNASISLPSLLGHAAICLLGIFLHLI